MTGSVAQLSLQALVYVKSYAQAWVASPFRKGEGEGLPLEQRSLPELEPLTSVLSPCPRGEASVLRL
jgi:hypothetical protein